MQTDQPPRTLVLNEIVAQTGSAEELEPKDRARFALAGRILFGLACLFVFASLALIYADDTRQPQAQAVFDFVTTFAPPVATLVIAFYFKSTNPD